jgi:maltose alpha-D-glucosyltransferase / alpha-amylase
MLQHAEQTLDLLASRLDALQEPWRGQAQTVVARWTDLRSRFERIRDVDAAGLRIRIHGDYHLGQVLRAEEDFIILDFEGEPARPIADRRRKQSPVKDVAGMVRSFSYAAFAALFAFTTRAPEEQHAALGIWADTWQSSVAGAFTEAYRAAIGADPEVRTLVPGGRNWTVMLDAFVLEKALYELGYELNHRPDWVRIPIAGILKLIG